MSRNGNRQGTKAKGRKEAQGATKGAKAKARRMVTCRRHKAASEPLHPALAPVAVEVGPGRVYTPPCPVCMATGEQPCITKSGNVTKDHAKRVR